MIWPLLIGISAFLVIVGPKALNPSNLAWIPPGAGDSSNHYLGWLFFRNTHWTFPIGLNPHYGLECSTSILYSDSNPLLAFFFKPFSPWLPEVFQYFGFWLLACFVLQALFSWKLVGLISKDSLSRTFGTGLFVFAPPMMWRLHGHLNLVGHFLILAALYLLLAPGIQKRKLLWGILLGVTALVHPYIFVMVALIWLADLFGKAIQGELSLQQTLFEFFILVSITSILCWQAGYFTVGGKGAIGGGFGFHRMNLLSLFDSDDRNSQWSYILKDLPSNPGEDEGFNFLGLGTLFLLICSLPAVFSHRAIEFWQDFRKSIKRYPLLGMLLIGFTLFAASNEVAFGLLEFKYPLPERVLEIANIFRASGRMFWPVFYTIVFAIIFLILRGYPSRTAAGLLGLAFMLQIADTHATWKIFHQKMMVAPKSAWDTPLTDPIWEEFASKYTKIRWITPVNASPHWLVFANYAATHHLATDVISLARVNGEALTQARHKAAESLRKGQYDEDSLYVLEETAAIQAAPNINSETDAFGKINGFYVLAPGWKKHPGGTLFAHETTFSTLAPMLQRGEKILFTSSQPHRELLGEGWWREAEEAGTWSDGPQGMVLLPLGPHMKEVTSFEIEGRPLLGSNLLKQNILVFINGIPAGNFTLEANSLGFCTFQVEIPKKAREIAKEKSLRLEFRFPNAAQPKDIGITNDDPRTLAMQLVSITPR